MAPKQELEVKAVKRQTLNQRVYENIKDSILSGALPPGSKLFEVQMAKRLGVSATPVREAFRMLSMEGLVRIEPWKGALVQQYSDQETLDVTNCRAALEVMALRLFFERMDDQSIRAIANLIDSYSQAETGSAFVQVSSAIHDIWLQGCGNNRLLVLMGQLNDVLLHDRNITANSQERKGQIVQEHRAILCALREKNLEGAVQALITHIYKGYAYSQGRG